MRKIENMMLTVFLVVSLICGKYLLDYWQDNYDNRQNYRQVEEMAFPEKDTQEDETEPNVDNPTTEIDEDNEFYLHHDFQKNYAICGTLMLDCRNDIDVRQEHLIIYGHQMRDGSMFKQLNGYKKEEYYPEHKEITLFLKNQKYQYEVAAVYVTNVAQSGGYYDFLHKETRKQQMDYLQQMAAYQLYPTGVTVREEDELLSLSTCEYSSTNGRLIVLARRIGR